MPDLHERASRRYTESMHKKIGNGCPAVLATRLQAAEAEAVEKLAADACMTTSAYLRKLALAAVTASKTETETA